MKKYLKIVLAITLVLACVSQTTIGAFAAQKSKEYVGEVIISYGDTAEEAKEWLTNKGYKYVDADLNEGASDDVWISKDRAVYLGYKTTTDPDKAITDMKLMNMNGGYSVQDYQIILSEKKNDIQQFIKQFISVISEYRTNYKKGSARAVTAHDILNMMKDDDTGMLMGDLLLNKIKEEYSDKDYKALSASEKKKHADMTTILMQGNAQMVLCIEQILATATDIDDTPWLERFKDAPDYFTMLEEVMDEENLTIDKAKTILSSRYGDDAKIIAGMAEKYKEWLSDYIDSGVRFDDDDEKITAYNNSHSEEEQMLWLTKGMQYEYLNNIEYDEDYSLLDIFIGDEFDLTGEDVYLLYPIVSVLSSGQRNSLDFVCMYQFITMGYSTDSVVEESNISEKISSDDGPVSVFSGVDRSIFGNEVALTNEAYKFQNSGEEDYSVNWFEDIVSDTAKIMGLISMVTVVVSVATWISYSVISEGASLYRSLDKACIHAYYIAELRYKDVVNGLETAPMLYNRYSTWSQIFYYASIGLTAVSVILGGLALWKAYSDLKEYYCVDFTPIPMWMVDQGVDQNNAKIFTYYKAVKCNRKEMGFDEDNTALLKDFGDLNGDVGKQWLALYTTTDKNAGEPILADFKVLIDDNDYAYTYDILSLFGEHYCQNLTDAKLGFTYNDECNGIYLYFCRGSANSGSAVTTGIYAAIAGGAVIIAAATFVIVRKKKSKATV